MASDAKLETLFAHGAKSIENEHVIPLETFKKFKSFSESGLCETNTISLDDPDIAVVQVGASLAV